MNLDKSYNMVTPRRPIQIPTKHLQLTRTEYLCYKWDSLKHLLWSRFGRHLYFVTLPNIAALLIIIFMFKLIVKGEDGVLMEYSLASVDRSLSSFKEMDFRMNMIAEQQERIREYANNEIQSLRSQFESSVNNLKNDIFTDLQKIKDFAETTDYTTQTRFLDIVSMLENNVTSKIQNLYSELANISNVVGKSKNVINETVFLDGLGRLADNFTSRLEVLRTNFTAGMFPLSNHNMGVNLASRRIGAKVIPSLTSELYTYSNYIQRLSAYIYSKNLYEWPITERSTMTPGDAFCFHGSAGEYTVSLAVQKSIKAVLYEHDFWDDIISISSPKDFQIWTCKDDCEQESAYELANSCIYSSNGTPAQVCNISKRNIDIQSVRMKILSNHGQSYTCLYSLRVYAL